METLALHRCTCSTALSVTDIFNTKTTFWEEKLRIIDSLNLEAGNVSSQPNHRRQTSWFTTLNLAFQSIGVIYGDIGTSPLYVFDSAFGDGKIEYKDDIIGVLSLIIYTFILIPLIIVLKANDDGNVGTFALYSLICRYMKVSFITSDQPEDAQLSNYKLDRPSDNLHHSQKIKEKLENSKTAKLILFLSTILGTSMVIGDGILTPCISVLSAVSGIKHLNQEIWHQQDRVFICTGYLHMASIHKWDGFYNLCKNDMSVLRAFNPKYIVDYFQRNGKKGWISLGGNNVLYELAFELIRFLDLVMICVNNLHVAAIIGSQAMISGSFAIISQSLILRCFPRVKVVHTSSKYEGQVYIPEVNYLLMIACVLVTYGFKTTGKIGNAYGIAVVAVMMITTSLIFLIMLTIWRTNIWLVVIFILVFIIIELLIENLKEFIRHEDFMHEQQLIDSCSVRKSSVNSSLVDPIEESMEQQQTESCISNVESSIDAEDSSNRIGHDVVAGVEEEMEFVERAKEEGVYYLMGEAEIVARQDSSLLNKFVINYAYPFLRKNFREEEKVLAIPRARLLKVGITYEI
ncbi:Potassium transporter 5 [Castilleja foliolosa]|uniref:Potassium transporter 5 n=1 Tax=Castilleja foliolosa TaxID=1961234 RepID=A0ABD3D461_9LAMI